MFSKYALVLSVIFCCLAFQPALARPTINVGGRLDLDFANYDSDVTPLGSGVELRRLRLGLGGKLTKKLGYYTLADFSTGDYAAQATWLRYRFNQNNELYAGRIELPFSLQRVTNSRFNLFMERALPAALSHHYGTGLVYTHKGRKWSWRAGLFGDDKLNFGGSKKSGTAAIARAGRKLRVGQARVWLGASYMAQDITKPERLRALPESSVTNASLVNSGRIFDLRKSKRVGLEAVWKKNWWSLQGEWIHYSGNRTDSPKLEFDGGYIEASRMFNGRRRFNFQRGEWMSPEIGKQGAWELSARISRIDLQNGAITGGEETNYSLGLNYYFSPINRIMFNAIKVNARPNKRGIDESPAILQLRLQVGF